MKYVKLVFTILTAWLFIILGMSVIVEWMAHPERIMGGLTCVLIGFVFCYKLLGSDNEVRYGK